MWVLLMLPRFGGANHANGHNHRSQLLTDAVDKVGDEQHVGNNRIQVPSFFNQYCAPDSDLESMLLACTSKNVFRQHRPKADIAVLVAASPSSAR
jgi:hypothetical protein